MQDLKNITDLLDAVKRANNELEIVTIGTKQDKNGNYRLRLRARSREINFEKHTYPLTKQGLKATIKIAQEIETDFFRGCFDTTLVKYGLAKPNAPKLTQITTLPINNEPDLKEIWENYKAIKTNSVAPRTKETYWTTIDSWLDNCPKKCLILSNADKLLAWLRTKHKDGGIKYPLRTLSAAVNLAIKLNKLKSANPLPALEETLKTTPKKKIQAYSKEEIKTIIETFKSGRFDKESSNVSSAYYAGLVEFRFLTGCRPSECIALTWDDIKWNGDKCQIVFNKRVAGRKDRSVQHGTKNGVDARIFPCNQQLKNLIKQLPKKDNPENLIFPSFRSNSYINQKDFNSDWWKPIVSKLVELGEVREYLPFYDQRHSFITHTIRSGVDIKTTGTISGNSTHTIINSYLASNDSIELPEI
ncbi:tyrosine-type recombinase/integrase [Sphaerospermopsis sp. FACHB-1194]|uniref:tyrosine-type recombinase/integrase n=1 Tax=Sphaerospermopsis sp. FACHB-1194 TaxID=2692862 RepID=UPI001680864A|nr:tyrosine-type recombinase/integrase [Sphaerospermopsis sp. FACHB-1194]MBD2148357.1 tyrosine-type recombinase/integrase [Sphaerospermopsis sp. FACHB-1194]